MNSLALADSTGGLMAQSSTAIAKELQQAQSQVVLAKKFPRNLEQVYKKIEFICGMPALAENSHYAYKRGGQQIRDANVHLVRAVAQAYGNFQTSWEETRHKGYSSVRVTAWDIENNVHDTLTVDVPHTREARGQTVELKSDRDIYEAVANMAARRLRKATTNIIPAYLLDEAKRLCDETVARSIDLKNAGPKLLGLFQQLNPEISQKVLEKHLGHSFANMSVADVVDLKAVYNSIKDGATNVETWFPEITRAKIAAKELEEKSAAELKAIKDAMSEKNRELQKLGGKAEDALKMKITDAKKSEDRAELEARLELLTEYVEALKGQKQASTQAEVF